MCNATYHGKATGTLICEVKGEHETATDEYGEHIIHEAGLITGTTLVREGSAFRPATYAPIVEQFTWDDLMVCATPAH